MHQLLGLRLRFCLRGKYSDIFNSIFQINLVDLFWPVPAAATECKRANVVRNLGKTDKKIMKLSKILISTIFFIQFSFLYSQENSEITQNWNQLNQKLIYRTEITLELVNEIKNSKKIDKATLHKTISSAKELKTICENKTLNKSEVKIINKKNNELSTYLVRTMVNIEQDAKLKSKEELLILFDQLYALENQIYAEIKKYNESCVKYEKEELIFEINEEKKVPKVEFK